MTTADAVLDSFSREEYSWSGVAVYRFWGSQPLRTYICVETWETGPTPKQRAILESLLRREQDFRPELEQSLFEHYQSNVYGTITYAGFQGEGVCEELTPTLKSSSEIWSLLGTPSVWIEDQSDADRRAPFFKLAFDCRWDDEHGLEVTVQNWKPVFGD